MNILKNKTFLITGGTGSFGRKLTEYLLKEGSLKKIIIFSRDEDKQHSMRIKLNSKKLEFRIGDVRDESSLEKSFTKVDFIFHAAALKHVPSCEFFPMEAIKTNILGTENVMNIANKNKVKKVILLSTDKACYPVNTMGATKMLMEKLVNDKIKSKMFDTKFCIVRYGNVLFSRGSVIPLFFQQINEKKNLTLTDKRMTRFLMSLKDAVNLVMHAIKNGGNGDLFIHKAKSALVTDIAKACLLIAKSKNKLNFIGIREGEKLSETLATPREISLAEDNKNFWKISTSNKNQVNNYISIGKSNISKYQAFNSSQQKLQTIQEISKIISQNDEYKILKKKGY